MTGPTIAEPVKVAVHSATTLGKCSGGARNGAIERRAGAIMASTPPNTNAMTNSCQTEPGSIRL